MSMKTKSPASRYRYCISRLSTLAVSTLTPALKVLSTTLPEGTFFSFVRTNAPPLPGFTCWNSTTVHSCPSRLRTRPFLRSLVVATKILCTQLRCGHSLDAAGDEIESDHPCRPGTGPARVSREPAALW